jgi:hypothetical protein
MSGVVLRCPNCGTTKGAAGECEACHEAEVRFYCTNHTPGRWLDAAACSTCGARFGDPVRPAPAAPRPPAPPTVPATPRTARKRTMPWLPDRASAPWVRRAPAPASEDAPTAEPRHVPAPDAPIAGLPDLIREVTARARRSRLETGPAPEVAAAGAALGGCLMRAVFIVVLLFLAVLVFSVMAGGFLLRGF